MQCELLPVLNGDVNRKLNISKVKIVHLIGSLTKGGAERFVIDLCNELSKNEQYDVWIISLNANDSANTFLKEINPRVSYYSLNKGRGFSLNVLLKLSKWLKHEQPDILHTHLNAFEYAMLYIVQNPGTRFFHTIHNMASFECSNILVKSIRKWFYRKNMVMPVTISADGSEDFKKTYNLRNDILIRNGRPDLTLSPEQVRLMKKYKSDKNIFLLVHVGRISAEKNQRVLIEAVQQFNSSQKNQCRLLIIGDVNDEILYKELQAIVGTDSQIEFLGGIFNIADYLSIADVFCLSSSFEGMPISLIEALSMGCISVCTPVGGINEMIYHGKTGFLSKDFSVDAFCNAIKEAVYSKNKHLIKENSIYAFKSKYHIEASAKKHVNAYTAK
ncbi:glycosyltransferase family 4 protein [Pedobacter sp. P351]|uniref:glycosyltransferase family 4 protein n=1 Tax=Pedobacter superstes TaxID=3133441 RepID=UPI0030B47207